MGYTREEIEQEFLGGQLAEPARAIEAFDRVERLLGRDGVDAIRRHVSGLLARGTLATNAIVDVGRRLESLEGLSNSEVLIEKLRKQDKSAFAELSAIHILRATSPDVDVEYEPEAVVADRAKRPDFRARKHSDPWVYVEVTRPETPESYQELDAKRAPLLRLADEETGAFTLEVLFSRDPTPAEVGEVLGRARALCGDQGRAIEEVAAIATLALNRIEPGVLQGTIPTVENAPVASAARLSTRDGIARYVLVRTVFSDDRAEKLLQREAKQLPATSPGLVMIHTSKASGGKKAWAPLLLRRFQPTINTRVGGVVMFDAAHEVGFGPDRYTHRAALLSNPHATYAIPAWIAQAVARFPPWPDEKAIIDSLISKASPVRSSPSV